MSIKANLQETIDRLVEDAIRRILPTVMNEVLMRTIVGSGALAEQRQPRRKKRVPVRAKAKPARKGRPPVQERIRDLRNLLDESAGAEFYGEGEVEPIVETRTPARRASSLAPHLQALAEDVAELPDDDGGEVWDGRGDSTGLAPAPAAIADLGRAASAIGVDFTRMAGTIKVTSDARPKVTSDDLRAKEQFEARRLKALRESLNGGKPLE